MQVIGSVLVFVYYPIAKDEAQNSIRDYTTDSKIADGWDTVQGVVSTIYLRKFMIISTIRCPCNLWNIRPLHILTIRRQENPPYLIYLTVALQLKCCGMNDHKDWKPSGDYPNLPFSCCADKIDQCSDTQTTLYSEGCDEKLFHFFNIIGGIGFGILVFEVSFHKLADLLTFFERNTTKSKRVRVCFYFIYAHFWFDLLPSFLNWFSSLTSHSLQEIIRNRFTSLS